MLKYRRKRSRDAMVAILLPLLCTYRFVKTKGKLWFFFYYCFLFNFWCFNMNNFNFFGRFKEFGNRWLYSHISLHLRNFKKWRTFLQRHLNQIAKNMFGFFFLFHFSLKKFIGLILVDNMLISHWATRHRTTLIRTVTRRNLG